MQFPRFKKENRKKGKIPSKGFILGEKEGEYFKEWRGIIERNIIRFEKGDIETKKKIFKKYEKYFDDEKDGTYFTLYDLKIYKNAILAEVEKEEKKLKNDVFLHV